MDWLLDRELPANKEAASDTAPCMIVIEDTFDNWNDILDPRLGFFEFFECVADRRDKHYLVRSGIGV